MGFVANNWTWQIDGVTQSTGPALSVGGLAAGKHSLSVSHRDFLDRQYGFSGVVEVLAPADYAGRVAATNASQLVLQPIITTTYLPQLLR